MKHWIKLLTLFLMVFVTGTASAQNVAKVGSTEYATIEEAVEAWGPGKTLTLLANVTTTSTVQVKVNRTTSPQDWILNLGDYTWTASGCNAFQLYAYDGTAMNQNNGLKIYANKNGGITASGKYCIECTYDVSTAGYRPRLEIHGGTYNGGYVVYYKSLTYNDNNVSNGPSTWFYKSNDGTEPVFNGNFALAKCPIYIYAGYFNGTSFNSYPVSSTANTNLYGGHFKTISAFPSANNNKGIIFGNYKVFVRLDDSIDVVNGAPATYEAKATKTLLLSSNQGVNYSDYVYYEEANDAINKYSSGTIEIILSEGVTATQNKSYRSGTLTIDASAEGSAYTGNITLTSTSAKFIIKFPEGQGNYGVSASTGILHVEETITDGIVTRTYSVISRVTNPEASVGTTNYSTVYDAFYAIDGTTDNKTIVLQKDVTNAGIVTNGTATGGDGKTVATFDLNGHSIGIGSVYAGNNADYTLTIIDSSEGKTGEVTNSDAELLILAITSLNDYSGTYTLKIQAGTWHFDPSQATVNGVTKNLVDEGYVAIKNTNDTWTVVEEAKVAQIVGGAKYASLQAAVDAAQTLGNEQTIVLLDNISGETVTIKEVANFKLTIDGKKDDSSNYTVDALIVVDGLRGNGGSTTNEASVTLQNIAFVKTTATDGIQASHYPHDLTIQDCTYTGFDNDKWFLNASVDGPLYGVTVKNVTVENARLIYANMADDAVFQNITATTNCKVGFNVKTSGTALIENCQVTTPKYAFRDYGDSYAGTFTLKDNTFVSTSEESDEGVIVNRGGIVGTTHINVESGTYTGHVKVMNNMEGVLAISGGYFSEEFPQNYIAADLVAQGKVCVPATDKEGFYTVGDPHYVAQIGETQYVSLQAALDAAHEMTGNVTVELIDDISDYSIVHQKEGLNLTIDGAQKKVTGNIIVDGDGRASGTETLTIQNIKFEGDGTGFCPGTSSFVEVPSTKTEGATFYTGKYNYAHNVTLTNCSFTSTTGDLTMAAIRATSGAGLYNVTINNTTGTNLHSLAQLIGTTGGSITSNTVSNSESFINVNGGGGEFTVSDNTFTSAEGADGYGVRENGTSTAVITLTNNQFTAANAVVLGKGNSVTAGTIKVMSGTYVGDITKTDAATGKIVISDGKFSAPLADAEYAQFIAEGLCGVNGLYPEEELAKNGVGEAIATVTVGEQVTKYASLEAAIAAAPDGATVTLLKDASGNGIQVPQGKYSTGLTVDFGGFTYTMDGEMVGSTGTQTQAFQLLKDNKITFKNGTITSEKAKMLVQNYSDLTLENMTLTLNNPNYTSAYTLSNNNGNVVIDGSTINANPAGGFAFDVCRYASYESVSVTVKGGSTINGDVEVSASGSDAKSGFTLMLEDGTISGDIVLDETAKAAMAATPDKAIVRKNDTFDQAAPEGYKWVSDGENTGTSTLSPRALVAQIGDVQYYSLADAVAAVPADGTETTIVMIADETFNDNAGVTIPAGKNIILDLNGKTVSQYAPDAKVSHLIENKGTLTIKDSSDTNKDGTGTGKLYSEAAQPSSGYGYATNLISNSGQLTIESGYLESHSSYASYVVDNYPGGNAVINGGHLYNYFTSAIRLFCNSTTAEDNVTVNGGIVEGYCTIWVQSSNNNANKGNLTINGGTFKTTEKAVVNGDKAIYEGNSYLYMYLSSPNTSITINGGTFDTNIATWGDGPISITGGIFNGYVYTDTQEGFITGGVYVLEVDDEYIAEGYKCGANTDEATKETNPYAVIPRPYVAQIGDVKYWSLADAVAAVPADGTETTITMIDNEMIDIVGSAITIPAAKNVVIDLNGFQVVGTAAQATSSALITNKGTLTIKDSSDTNADGTGTGKLISGATETWIYNGDGNYAGSYASNTITNSGTLTIQSGYIENLSTGSATYAVDNNSSGGNAILNMNGGVLKAHSVAVREFANSTTYENTINMAGGTIQATNAGIWIQLPGSNTSQAPKAALNVTGGTLIGTYAFYDYTYGNSFAATQYQLDGGTFNGYIFSYGANINITDGTYNGDVAIKQTNPSTVSVSGGKFAGDVYTYGANASEAFISGGIFASTTYEEDGETLPCDWPYLLAEDFVVGANTDEATKDAYPYMVRPGVFVAQIVGGAKYESLEDAIAAVPANGTEATTIKLLVDNLDEDAIIDGGKNIILDLNEKTLKGGIDQYEGNVTLTNGTLQGTVYVNGGASSAEAGYNHFTLANDATINAGYGIILWQGPNGNDAYGSVIDINGAVNGNLWVMGNITEGNSVINVNSGASIKGEVVGLNGLATLNVKDGATIEGSETGIEVRAGVLNVTGGTITSTASAYTFTPNGSGTTTTGAAIAVAQHNTALPVEVNINGGTLNGVQDIAVIDAQSNDLTDVTVVVKDELITDKTTIPEDFKWVAKEGKEGFSTLSPKDYVAQIGDKKYESLAEAIAAVPENGTETTTILLLANITESASVSNGKNIILDLNEKTLTGNIGINGGSLTAQNGTIAGTVNVYGSADASATNYNNFTLAADATINAGYGIILREASGTNVAYGATININGAVNGNLWVMGNIKEGNSVINVNNGAKVKGEVVGLNGLATLNVKSGATIEGSETGIEVRAGVLNVEGGTITSTASAYTYNPNGSGTTTTGAAIAVAQHNTVLPIEVNILGGTLSGIHNIAVEDAQDNNLDKVTVTVKDNLIIASTLIPDGFTWASNNDGTSTLKPAVAKIGDTYYATIEDAFAAITEGCEVILLDDVEMTKDYTAAKSFSLTTDGHTFDSQGHHIILNNGVTVTTDDQQPGLYEPIDSSKYAVKEEVNGDVYTYTCMTIEDYTGEYALIDIPQDTKHPYTFTVAKQANKVTYHREIHPNAKNNYQCWFVPIDYTITEEDVEEMDFYKIHMIAPEATDGQVESGAKVLLYIEKVEAGTKLSHNRPYIIRTKGSKLVYDFVAENVTLYPIDNSVRLEMATSKNEYKFYGTYHRGTIPGGVSLLRTGLMNYVNPGTSLDGYKWYFQENKKTQYEDYANTMFFIVEEGETTSISDFNITEGMEIEGIYTIDGKKLDHPIKGLNIIKMKDNTVKKVYIK